MTGGLFSFASRFAVIAAAGLMTGGMSAKAADLGGDCCADLEERVAELEATTVRKGNRKVSLQVSGHVSQTVYYWDDGRESNVYVGQYGSTASRLRFAGSAKINPTWSTGYLLEFGILTGGRSERVSAERDTAYNMIAAPFQLRHSAWWIENKQLGRLWIGQTDTASAGITVINLANTAVAGATAKPGQNLMSGFALRTNNNRQLANRPAGLSAVSWSNLRNHSHGDPGTGDRYEVVKYVSPTLMGFILSAAWGEDDMWDVALRYAGEFSGFKIAAGIGYGQWTDRNFSGFDISSNTSAAVGSANNAGAAAVGGCGTANGLGLGGQGAVLAGGSDGDCETFALSGAVMHVPTGLFVHGSYGQLSDGTRNRFNTGTAAANRNDRKDTTDTFWYVQAGIEQKWFSLGKTTVYGEYHQQDVGSAVNQGSSGGRVVAGGDPLNGVGVNATMFGAEVTTWGFGVVQAVDAAALDLFINYRHVEGDLTLRRTDNGGLFKSNPIADAQYVSAGAMIKF